MRIGMLGPFEVRTDDGGAIDVPGSRLRGLLIALALRAGRVAPKSTLIDWIWGAHPPADAVNALQRLVSRLRKVLPENSVEGRPDGYLLAVHPDDVDALRFERLATGADGDARRLREALALWRGAALQDVGLPDSGACDAVVTRLEGMRLTALEDRFEAEIELGRDAELVTELTDLVAAHPVRERLVAALMRALAAAGRDADALRVYQRLKDTLADELGVDPSPELSALHVALLRGESGRRDENRRTNLRKELTSYVGKDADLAAVARLVADHRLTTLIGPGGSGKTRLATETGRALVGDLRDGAWLVELAAIGADGDVAQATLAAFGLRDTLLGEPPSTEPADRLVAAIRDRETLLILDNCEHVIDNAAALAHRLLGECPRLRILATSREPLGITGEALWPVAPLTMPDEDADPRDVATAPAVRLFRDRASAVRPDLAIDDRTLTTMGRVCRVLDGMPLAIELAAARLRAMTVDQLADRLDDRFRVLTGGSRTALPRHRTLRAMVDWSWELLTDAERTVLCRLSVFAGGADLDAAERVCGGAAAQAPEILDLLTALTEKSLLVVTGDTAPRYRMLGTIKEYAAQRLAEAGQTDEARRAHLAHFTALTTTADPHLRRAEQLRWLAVLAAEHDNIGAAMRGAIAAGEAQEAMALAAGAGWYWWLSGHKTEGQELITAAGALSGRVDDETKAIVYGLLGMFASSGRASEKEAAEWIHETYRLRERSGSTDPVLALVVPLERMLRDPDSFLTAWESLLDNADPWVRALARLHLGKQRGMLGLVGPEAEESLTAALAEFRAIGERFGIYFALTELADLIALRGEFAGACAHIDEAIAVVTEVGSVEDVIRMRARQAQLYWLQGDEESAANAMAEAERNAEAVTWREALVELAFAKAELAHWRGRRAEARGHLDDAMTMLGDQAERAVVRGSTSNLLGRLAEDPGEARDHYAAAVAAAAEAGFVPMIAQTLVGLADLESRRGRPEHAARLLGASERVRGLRDRSQPDIDRVERDVRDRLGDEEFTEAAVEGAETGWERLAEITLAS